MMIVFVPIVIWVMFMNKLSEIQLDSYTEAGSYSRLGDLDRNGCQPAARDRKFPRCGGNQEPCTYFRADLDTR